MTRVYASKLPWRVRWLLKHKCVDVLVNLRSCFDFCNPSSFAVGLVVSILVLILLSLLSRNRRCLIEEFSSKCFSILTFCTMTPCAPQRTVESEHKNLLTALWRFCRGSLRQSRSALRHPNQICVAWGSMFISDLCKCHLRLRVGVALFTLHHAGSL